MISEVEELKDFIKGHVESEYFPCNENTVAGVALERDAEGSISCIQVAFKKGPSLLISFKTI